MESMLDREETPILARYQDARQRSSELPDWLCAFGGALAALLLLAWSLIWVPFALLLTIALLVSSFGRRAYALMAGHTIPVNPVNPWRCLLRISNDGREFNLGVGETQFRTGLLLWSSEDISFRISREDVEAETEGDLCRVLYSVHGRELTLTFKPDPYVYADRQVFFDFFRIWEGGPPANEASIFPPITPPLIALASVRSRATFGLWLYSVSLFQAIAASILLFPLFIGGQPGSVLLLLISAFTSGLGVVAGRLIHDRSRAVLRDWAQEIYFASTLPERAVPHPKMRVWSG